MTVDLTDAVYRPRPVNLRDIGRIPLRRWRTVVAVAGLICAVTAGYLLASAPTYTATSVVVVRAVATDPFALPNGGADRSVNMTAENGLASGTVVIDEVAKATGRTARQAAAALDVVNPAGGQVLRFSYTGGTEAEAVTGANTAAQAYLVLRRGMYEEQRKTVVESYDATVKELTAQRTKTRKGLSGSVTDGTSAKSTAVLDQLKSLNDQIASLGGQRAKVLSADLTPGVVTQSARGPVPSSHANLPLLLLIALAGGLLVGALVSYLHEALDRRVRSGADAAEIAGVPLLGRLAAPRSGQGLSIGYLALAIAGWTERQPGKPVVVVSNGDDEGRAQVSASLAAGLARVGHDVYLGAMEHTDELRNHLKKAQERTPEVAIGRRAAPAAGPPAPADEGQAGWVTAAPTDAVVVSPPGDELDLVRIGAGSVRLGPMRLDTGEQMVIFDAPATGRDDRGVWAAKAGLTVMVAGQDRTPAAGLSRLATRLRAAGVQPVGVVLTGAGHD
ncbi:MAG TPA: hypothetical protein VFO77_05210 [Actinoplanes sp.]|nr:hypothetical protein [Actinoplanes sp.]